VNDAGFADHRLAGLRRPKDVQAPLHADRVDDRVDGKGEGGIGRREEQHPVPDPVRVEKPVLDHHRHLRVPFPRLDQFHPEVPDQLIVSKDLLDAVHRSPFPFCVRCVDPDYKPVL